MKFFKRKVGGITVWRDALEDIKQTGNMLRHNLQIVNCPVVFFPR